LERWVHNLLLYGSKIVFMQDSRELELSEEGLENFGQGRERITSNFDSPEKLESESRILNQFKRGYEPLATASMATISWSLLAFFPIGKVSRAALIASNLGPAYGAKNTYRAQSRQNQIDRELENWQLYENDFDLSPLFEDAEPIRGFNNTDSMQASYDALQNDFKEIGDEIDELAGSDIHDDTFAEDLNYGLQAARFEEDDFGTVEFQLSMFLGEDEIAVYHGHTKDRKTVETLKEEGLTAKENKDLLGNYFDMPNPLGVRYTRPDCF